MAEPAGCGNGCFETTWSNCVFLSAELRAYATSKGIVVNDCLETLLWGVLSKLPDVEDLETLKDSVKALDASKIPAGVSAAGLGGASSDAVAVSERTFSYVAADNKVSYDFSAFKNGLPEGSYLRQVRATAVTDTGKTASIKGIAAQVPLQNLRGTVQFEALVETPNGLLEFNKIEVLNGSATSTAILQVNDRTVAPSNMSTQEALQLAISEITLLKQKVQDLQSRV